MKKIISVLLTACLMFSIISTLNITVSALSYEKGTLEGGIEWTFDNGNLTLKGNGDMPDYPFDGPEYYEYRALVKTLVIEDGITGIGQNAFNFFSALRTVKLPKSVKSIHQTVFEKCGDLTKIYYAGTEEDWNSIEINQDNMFLKYVAIAVTDYSFGYCGDDLRWTFKDGTITISGTGLMYDSNDFTLFKAFTERTYNVVINEGVESIGDFAFFEFKNLESIDIPSSVLSIGNGAFSNCENLESIDLPEGIAYIGMETFCKCTKLKYIDIPDSVIEIAPVAFLDCTGLVSVSLPANLTNIENNSFEGCTVLKDVFFDGTKEQWEDLFGSISIQGITSETLYFEGGPKEGALEGDASWTIDDDKFILSGDGETPSLSSIPEKYKQTVTEIELEDGITTIGEYAFGEFKNLKNVILPEGVCTIKYGAFLGCSKLESIELPSTLKEVGHSAFFGCFSLKNVKYNDSESKWEKVTVDLCNDSLLSAVFTFIPDEIEIPKVIENPKLVAISKVTYTYNGKVITPSVVAKDKSGKIISKKFYSVSYSKGRKSVGKYNVKIIFKGDFKGTYTKSFKIIPKNTSIKKLTPSKKAFTAKWKAQKTQTTGYQIRYSLKSNMSKSKTITVSKNKTVSKKISKLKSKKTYYVQIRTYKKTGKISYTSSWTKAKKVKVK